MNERLKEIDIENHIWVIYILIIMASWYSNKLEKDYFIYKNELYKEKYRQIIIKIFSVLLIVYFYFFKSSIDGIRELKDSNSLKKKQLTELSAIASLLIVISGLIFLYIAYKDTDISVEVAFN